MFPPRNPFSAETFNEALSVLNNAWLVKSAQDADPALPVGGRGLSLDAELSLRKEELAASVVNLEWALRHDGIYTEYDECLDVEDHVSMAREVYKLWKGEDFAL